MDIEKKADALIKAYGSDTGLMRFALGFSPVGVIVTDIEGRIVFYNKSQAKMDGNEQSEVIGKLEHEVLTPLSGSTSYSSICHKTGEPIMGYIYHYRTFKGRELSAFCWVFPLLVNNRLAGSICFNHALLNDFSHGPPKHLRPIQWPSITPVEPAQDSLVGGNPIFQKALLLARSNGGNPLPVLVTGETGSGKELFAKLIHQSSTRADKPFMALNCSAIPRELLEGLLFGTVKGSFTGSIDRPGLLEEANGGTIYLDEIDSMSLELQPKLLRVLQEMRVTRIGSTRPVDLDLKLVSSISLSPQQALSSGNLRPDLFYRLAVVIIDIPPLRRRMDDLEFLCSHFMRKFSKLLNKDARKVGKNLWAMMSGYDWPGNIRELEHMIAGAVAALPENENVITIDHVPNHYIQAFASADSLSRPEIVKAAWPGDSLVARSNGDSSGLSKVEALLKVDPEGDRRNQIANMVQAMKEAGGNISRAAKVLGLSRQVLSYRLLKLGLNRRDFK